MNLHKKYQSNLAELKKMTQLLNPAEIEFSNDENFEELIPEKMFGRYKIEQELGRGGMGVVYKAYDSKLKTFVALKVLLQEQASESIERFLREASATAQLNHPNIVRFYEARESPKPYFTMEYIEGVTLADLIKERKIKSWNLITLMIKLCEALHYAHKNKILHRDIKPSNIMITKQGQPKIMDFGLAKITQESMQDLSQSGQILGTLLYMSPEQVSGKATYQSDIYSIGATIYEAITFRPIYQGDNQFNLIYQIMDDNPIPPRRLNPDISPYLEAICLKCLQKKPKHRYQDFKQLSKELRNFKTHKPIIAKKYSKWDSLGYFAQKNKKVCAAILFVFLSLFIFTISVSIIWKNENRINKLLNKKTVQLDEKASDLTKLVKAMMTSLKYIAKTEHRKLFNDRKFLNSITVVIDQSERLQNAEEFRSLRGLVSWYKGKNIAKSIAELSKAISLNPNSTIDYENRGSLYIKQKKYQKAIEDFTKAISLVPSALSYSNRGNAYFGQKKYQKVVEDLTKAISITPKARYYLNRGRAYFKLKKYQKAMADFNKAISLAPKARYYLNRGHAYFKLKNYQKAIDDYNKAISLDPKYGKTYRYRGILYFEQKKYQKAIADFTKYISLNPNLADVYKSRGRAYYKQKKYQQAIKDWKKALFLGAPKQELSFWIKQATEKNKR